MRLNVKEKVTALALAMATVLSLSACSTNEVKDDGSDGKITEVTLSESWNFESGFHTLQSPNVVNGTFGLLYYINNFYETLVNYENGEIVPNLAESWEISDDGMTYTFHLKKDIKFSDGSDLNAEVVKVNLDNIPATLGQFNGSFGLTSTLMKEVVVVDKYTVAVHLTTPYYGALQDFTSPLPMAIMAKSAYNEDGTLSKITKTKTLGTGAYMYDGQRENDVYTFVKNPHYKRGNADVDTFHIKVIPDHDSKLLALRSGEIDMILGSGNLTYNSFNDLSKDEAFKTIASDVTIQSRTIGFNLSNEKFADKAVRLAVNHALDKKTICDNLFFGVETPADTVLDTSLPYCDVKTTAYHHNFEKANSLLDEAGWMDNDNDGIREKNGVKLEANLLYASDRAMLSDYAHTIASQLEKVGFKVTPVGTEQMNYFAEISNNNFDMAIAITNSIPYDPYLLVSKLKHQTVIDNYLAQGLKELEHADELISSLNGMTDEKEIQAVYNTLLTELHKQATIIPMSRVKGMAAYRNDSIAEYDFYNQPDYVDISAITLK